MYIKDGEYYQISNIIDTYLIPTPDINIFTVVIQARKSC